MSDLILNQFESLYGGMMAVQSQTFDGLSSTLADAQTELNSFMGAGYNETRKAGLRSEIDFLSGENGLAMQEAYSAIGAWQADLENQKESYIRKALEDAMDTDEYVAAKQAGDAAEMGRIIMAAKVQGQNEYNASEGAMLQRESELSLIQSIREDTGLNSEYWDAGYKLGLEFSKGRAAATMNGEWAKTSISGAWTDDGGNVHGGQSASGWTDDGGNYHAYAYGLPRVPYDNFPAMLHEGERVLTASEARGYGQGREQSGGVNITVTGNSFGGAYSAEEVAREIAIQVLRAAELSIPQ
ncbi:hypothetical protein SDC9_140737 [bioreactor metagenome]|uniref:Uncharacterized protein n=1 Tax=bioreactor metagenome TaxID=1076179 RepID=A0A645DW48_9ZZZZ